MLTLTSKVNHDKLHAICHLFAIPMKALQFFYFNCIHYAPKFLIEIHCRNKSGLYDINVQVSTRHLVPSINPNIIYISYNILQKI